MSKWISVDERLPDEVGKYLCAFSDGTVESFDFDKADDGRYGITDVGNEFYSCRQWQVTHWMELPKHPEEL
ncbi:hypothetical protein VPHK375_0004 [Vibrio phage K375]|nr:hypothetical protein MYOV024v1_p0048 [Vibrio phage PS34B.2]